MIFVTGGTGLVGSSILFKLALQGKTIRALRRSSSKMDVFNRTFNPNSKLIEQIEWVEGDVNDVYSLFEALKGVTEVYHAAGLISFQPSDFRKLMKVNIEGTANLVNVSLEYGVGKFCHISSVAAIGRLEQLPKINEDVVWKTSRKNSAYAISKYGAEREVWRGIEEGLQAVILNPSIIIGAGDWNHGSGKLFGEVWNGLHFYTEGITGFIDIRDVTHCAVELMKKGISSQRYILNAENISYREVFNTIAEFLGKKKPSIAATPLLTELAWRGETIKSFITRSQSIITKETARNSHSQWFYSNEKIKKEMGIEFIPIRKSIEDVCKIFLSEKKNNAQPSIA